MLFYIYILDLISIMHLAILCIEYNMNIFICFNWSSYLFSKDSLTNSMSRGAENIAAATVDGDESLRE